MAKRTEKHSPLRLQGAPDAVQALLPSSAWGQLAELPTVELDVPEPEAASVQVATMPGGQARALRLELASTTPPGSYTGLVRLPAGEWPLAIEVAPSPRLVAASETVAVTAKPGGEGEVELEVANAGNVPCEVPAVYAFGLFESDGLDRSFGTALRADVSGLDRGAVLADELAASHGGLVRVRVHEGSGTLKPGEARTLRVSMHLDEGISPGRTFIGYWRVHAPSCTLKVLVTVPDSKEAR
jgi:hypothetical protein